MAELHINGSLHKVDVPADTPLLWVLRDELGLTGTKYGCGIAQCGACTVHLDGRPTRACITPVSAVTTSARVVTVEGLDDAHAQAVQSAWVELDVPQCGWCQSGQVMAATALLRETPAPTDEDIDRAMSGNLCRCVTYDRIRAAIHRASQDVSKGQGGGA